MSDTEPCPAPETEQQLELPFEDEPPWSELEGQDLGLPNPGHLERNPPR